MVRSPPSRGGGSRGESPCQRSAAIREGQQSSKRSALCENLQPTPRSDPANPTSLITPISLPFDTGVRAQALPSGLPNILPANSRAYKHPNSPWLRSMPAWNPSRRARCRIGFVSQSESKGVFGSSRKNTGRKVGSFRKSAALYLGSLESEVRSASVRSVNAAAGHRKLASSRKLEEPSTPVGAHKVRHYLYPNRFDTQLFHPLD